MDLIIVIIIGILLLIIGLFIQGGIFYMVEKLFRIANANYKNSLKIILFLTITQLVLIFLLWVINFYSSAVFFSNVSIVFAVFLVFFSISFFCVHYFLKKYHVSMWKKSLGIFLIYIVISYAVNFLMVNLMVKPIRDYIISPFYIEGPTMSPTLNSHDYVLVKKFDRNFSQGDIIVFRYVNQSKYPDMNGSFLIKRIIGLPGEKVAIQDGKVFINDGALEEPYIRIQTPGATSLVLNKDEYFVLGDNRSKSLDSRFYGPISSTNIQGKVFFTIHSSQWNFLKTFPGNP